MMKLFHIILVASMLDLFLWSRADANSIKKVKESNFHDRVKRNENDYYVLNYNDGESFNLLSCNAAMISCANRGCEETRSPEGARCLCHPFCLYTGSCCYDYKQLCSSKNETIGGTTEVIENSAPSMRKRTRCEVINGFSYQYIVSCPSDWEGDPVRRMCEVEMDQIYKQQLVQAKDVTYLNIFCAMCNDANNTDIAYWPSRQQCSLSNSTFDVSTLRSADPEVVEKLIDGLERGGQCCRYTTVPDGVFSSDCTADVCSCSTPELDQPCGTYKLDIRTYYREKYSSPHCYKCSTFPELDMVPIGCYIQQHDRNIGELGNIPAASALRGAVVFSSTVGLVASSSLVWIDVANEVMVGRTDVCINCSENNVLHSIVKFHLCRGDTQSPISCASGNIADFGGNLTLMRQGSNFSAHSLNQTVPPIIYSLHCIDYVIKMCELGSPQPEEPVLQQLEVVRQIGTMLIGVETSATLLVLIGILCTLGLFLHPDTKIGRNAITKLLSFILILSGISNISMFYLPLSVTTENMSVCLAFGLITHYLWLAIFIAMAAFCAVVLKEFLSVAPSSSSYTHVIIACLSSVFPSFIVCAVLVYWKLGVEPGMSFSTILFDIYAQDKSCFLTSKLNINLYFFGYPLITLSALTVLTAVIFIFVIRFKSEHTVGVLKKKVGKETVPAAVFSTLLVMDSSLWIASFADDNFTPDIRSVSFWWLYSIIAYLKGMILLLIFIMTCRHNRRIK